MTLFRAIALMFALLWPAAATARADGGTVYSVNYPLAFFAERIAGDELTVAFPAPADVDPAYWRPDTETLLAYQSADLILLNGAGYTGWVDRVSLPRGRLVDTSAAFRDRLIVSEVDAVEHTHGPEGDHEHHSNYAFTTWLDISLARLQAQAVHDALARRWPDKAEDFSKRFEKLDSELVELETLFAKVFSAVRGQKALASHPVYQYVDRSHGLDLFSFHWEPDRVPNEEDIKAIEKLIAGHGSSVMIWEGEPTRQMRTELKKRGVRILVLPILSNRPAEGAFIENLKAALGN